MSIADLTPELLRAHPLPSHDDDADKNARGAALAIGGGRAVPGALLLAGIGALRAGSGKLQMATVADVAPMLGLHVPEALVVGLPATPDGEIDADAAPDVLARSLKGADALLIGPGMMNVDEARRLARALAGRTDARLALDAGALAAAGDEFDGGGRTVMTPHAGEMAHMLDMDADAVAADPEGVAVEAARRFNAVVALKGGTTIVATPGGDRFAYRDGRVGLATSGSGDTLAGVVLGLLARGADPETATLWGVFLHGEAGNRLAATRGPLGFLARELLAEVPAIMAGV